MCLVIDQNMITFNVIVRLCYGIVFVSGNLFFQHSLKEIFKEVFHSRFIISCSFFPVFDEILFYIAISCNVTLIQCLERAMFRV